MFPGIGFTHIVNIFQSCLKQFMNFNAIFKNNLCICKSKAADLQLCRMCEQVSVTQLNCSRDNVYIYVCSL